MAIVLEPSCFGITAANLTLYLPKFFGTEDISLSSPDLPISKLSRLLP